MAKRVFDRNRGFKLRQICSYAAAENLCLCPEKVQINDTVLFGIDSTTKTLTISTLSLSYVKVNFRVCVILYTIKRQ